MSKVPQIEVQTAIELTSNMPQFAEEQARANRLNRLQMVRTLSKILTMTAMGSTIIALWAVIAGANVIVALSWAVACIIFFASFVLTNPTGSSPQRANYVICLQVGGVQVVVILNQFQPNSPGSILVLLLAVPVLVGVLDFKGILRYLLNLLTVLLLVGLYGLNETNRLAPTNPHPGEFDKTGIAYLVLAYLVITPVVAVFVRQQKQATELTMKQAAQLSELVHTLASTTSFGAIVSQDLAGVTARLSATSNQQATNGHQLMIVITEVTASLQELNTTASQIAVAASTTGQVVEQSVLMANEVKESSELAAVTGLQGKQAVEQANQSVEYLYHHIELLGERLLQLTNQTEQVSKMIELIEDIAVETHLLALNASIEAAGTIGANESRQGERFSVIAHEVRNLAQRTRQTAEEVRQATHKMQLAMTAALTVAEESKREIATASARSLIAGDVIEKLDRVVANSAIRASQILTTAEEVRLRSQEIQLAIDHQQSASRQILTTMQQVTQISQEAVSSVSQLSDTAVQVNRQVDELNLLLAKSTQIGAFN